MNRLSFNAVSIMLLVVILLAFIISACTFQPAANGLLGGDTPSTETPPPYEPDADVLGTPTPTLDPSVTQEILPSPETEAIDEWQNVSPQGVQILFDYVLPPLSSRDIALNQIVDLFNQTNPYNIQVIAYNQASNDVIAERLANLNQTPDMPAIVMSNPVFTDQLINEGFATDLTSLIDSPTWSAGTPAFLPAMLASAQPPLMIEQINALPFSRPVYALFYNLDWLLALGEVGGPDRYEQMQTLSCTAIDQPFTDDAVQTTGLIYPATLDGLTLALFADSIPVWDEFSIAYTLEEAADSPTLQALQSLGRQGCLDLEASPDESLQRFLAGETLFWITTTDHASAIQQANEFTWGMSQIPALPGSTQPLLIGSGPDWVITTAAPEKQLAAWLFAQFTYTQDAYIIWGPASGEFPPYSGLTNQTSLPPKSLPLFNQLSDFQALPTLPEGSQVDFLVSRAMQDIVNGASLQITISNLSRQVYAAIGVQP